VSAERIDVAAKRVQWARLALEAVAADLFLAAEEGAPVSTLSTAAASEVADLATPRDRIVAAADLAASDRRVRDGL